MVRSAATLSVLSLATLNAGAQSVTWNPTTEFSIDHGNPNGVWSYGWMPVGLGLLTRFENHAYDGTGGSPHWIGWAGDGTPGIWRNLSTGIAYGVQPGQLSLHPGPGQEPCVVRWTAPPGVSGPIRIVGKFWHGDIGSTRTGVLINGGIAWTMDDGGAFDLSTSIQADQTVDFFVDQGYGFGNTPLEVVIAYGIACQADLDDGTMTGTHDGGVDINDLLYFIAVYEAGSVAADLDDGSGTGVHDGAVTIDDLLFFLTHYEGGC